MAFINGPIQIISDNIISNVIYVTQDTLDPLVSQCMTLENYAQLQHPMILTFAQPQEHHVVQQTQLNISQAEHVNTTLPSANTLKTPVNVFTRPVNAAAFSIDNLTPSGKTVLLKRESDEIFDPDGAAWQETNADPSLHDIDSNPDDDPLFNNDDLTDVLNDLRDAGIEITVHNQEPKKVKKCAPGRPGRPRKDGVVPLKKTSNVSCGQCGVTCRSNVMLERHTRKVHPSVHKCDVCQSKFISSNDLILHSATHWQPGQRCPMSPKNDDSSTCPSSFSRRAVLRSHLQRNHCKEEEVLVKTAVFPKESSSIEADCRKTCEFCKKVFDKPSQLERHRRSHTGEKPYICAHCGTSFTQKNSLVLHMIKHTDKRPFNCLHCSATFRQRGNCRTHMLRVHTLKGDAADILQCPHCSCMFKTARTLNVHIMRNHQNLTEDQIMKSTIADVMEGLASLSDQSRGNKHDLLQTALSSSGITQPEPPAPMSTVYRASLGTGDSRTSKPRIFSVPSMKDGDGNSAYFCPTCRYRFKEPSDLIRHMAIHTSEKKYQCEICNRRFLLSASLTLHLKNGHKVRTKKAVVPKIKIVKSPPPKKTTLNKKKQPPDTDTPCIPIADDNAVNMNGVFYSMPLIDTSSSDVTIGALTESAPVKNINMAPAVENKNVLSPVIGVGRVVNPVIGGNSIACPVIGVSNYGSDPVVEGGGNIADSVIDGSLLGLDTSQFSGLQEHVLDGHSMSLDMGNILDGEDVLVQQPIRDMKNIKMNNALNSKINQHNTLSALQSALTPDDLDIGDNSALYDPVGPTNAHKPDYLSIPDDNLPSPLDADLIFDGKNISLNSMTEIQNGLCPDILENALNAQPSDVDFNSQVLQMSLHNHPTPNEFSLQNSIPPQQFNTVILDTDLGIRNNVNKPADNNMAHFQYYINLPSGQVALLNADAVLNSNDSLIIKHDMNIISSLVENNNEFSVETNRSKFVNFNEQMAPVNKPAHHKDGKIFNDLQLCGSFADGGNNDFCQENYQVSFNGDLVLDNETSVTSMQNCGSAKRNAKQNNVLSDAMDIFDGLVGSCGEGGVALPKYSSTPTDTGAANPAADMDLTIPPPKKFFKTKREAKGVLVGLEACKQSLMKKNVYYNPRLANKCTECLASFSRPSDLTRHMRTHTKEKPYSCAQCGRCFSLKSSLKMHQAVHLAKSQRKLFSCQVCGKMMTAVGALATHMKLHTGTKPHSCPVCQSTFRTIGHRNFHLGTHFKEHYKKSASASNK